MFKDISRPKGLAAIAPRRWIQLLSRLLANAYFLSWLRFIPCGFLQDLRHKTQMHKYTRQLGSSWFRLPLFARLVAIIPGLTPNHSVCTRRLDGSGLL